MKPNLARASGTRATYRIGQFEWAAAHCAGQVHDSVQQARGVGANSIYIVRCILSRNVISGLAPLEYDGAAPVPAAAKAGGELVLRKSRPRA